MTVTATMYSGTFHGRADQVRRVRAAVARYLDGCPAADDAVLVVSEIAANAVLHSQSGGGAAATASWISRGRRNSCRPVTSPKGLANLGGD